MTLWLQSQFNLDMFKVENKESIAINAILIFTGDMLRLYGYNHNSISIWLRLKIKNQLQLM